MYWTPPQMFKDQDVYIIGGGTSLTDFDWNLLKDKNTIGCNDAYTLGEDICKICIFSDPKWFEYHKDLIADYKGIVVANVTKPHLYKGYNLKIVYRRNRKGCFRDGLAWNGNTGASAINLAAQMGAKNIFLLGFDCKLNEDGLNNWHENNVNKPNADVFKRFINGFKALKMDLGYKYPNVNVYNINNDSDLVYFNTIPTELFWNEDDKTESTYDNTESEGIYHGDSGYNSDSNGFYDSSEDIGGASDVEND
jgi:hypothetical protein